jgi:hypothetical protein
MNVREHQNDFGHFIWQQFMHALERTPNTHHPARLAAFQRTPEKMTERSNASPLAEICSMLKPSVHGQRY